MFTKLITLFLILIIGGTLLYLLVVKVYPSIMNKS